jgi:hypothetical protein
MLAASPFTERFLPSPAAETTTTSSMRCDEVIMVSEGDNIAKSKVPIIFHLSFARSTFLELKKLEELEELKPNVMLA